jgi:hypothetical protein
MRREARHDQPGHGAGDERRVDAADFEARCRQCACTVIGELAPAHVGVARDQLRHRLWIEAADQHRAADAGIARQREEARHALGIGTLPVLGGVGIRRHMADVVAGAEQQGVESRERTGVRRQIVERHERQLRHRRAWRRRLPRGDADRVSETLQMQRGMAADQTGTADDENLHRRNLRLPAGAGRRRGSQSPARYPCTP